MHIQQLQDLPPEDVPALVDKFVAWFQSEARGGNSRATQVHYGATLRHFSEACEAMDGPINRQAIRAFLNRPRRGGGPTAQATWNRELAAVRRFYKYLIDEQDLAIKNPSAQVECPEPKNVVPKAIAHDDWLQLWLCPKLAPDERVWLGLAYFGGLRRSALDTLMLSGVNIEDEEVTIILKGGDELVVEYGAMADIVTDAFPRLSPKVDRWKEDMGALLKQRWGRTDLPYLPRSTGGRDMSHSWVNKDLKLLLVMAGHPADLFSPHAMRHSCVTNLRRSGIERSMVADFVGHKNEQTTRRYESTAGTGKRVVTERRERRNWKDR